MYTDIIPETRINSGFLVNTVNREGRTMDNNIIILTNNDHCRTTAWKMILDLREIADRSGRRVKDNYNGGTFVSYPLPRAKRLMKLIAEYGKEEDFEKCDKYFSQNKKLLKYWMEIRPMQDLPFC